MYSRLLQCPNSRLRGATTAHLAQLEAHAEAAHALRRSAPRAPFELGWAAWSRGDYRTAASCFRHVLLLAAEADDDIFVCIGSWALASAVAMGGGGPLVSTAQIRGLMRSALAAERRLRRWGMAAAVKSIAAFARQPLRRLALPDEAVAILATPELRAFARGKPGQGAQRQCDGCKGGFVHMLKCGGCRLVQYCSRECQRCAWPGHKHTCSRSCSHGSTASHRI